MSAPPVIREPGIYDIPEADYHADPVEGGSLSSSGARLLLPPSCPALFQASTTEYRDDFDVGSAAHKLVLGKGPEVVEVVARDWRTKAAQKERDEARAAGKVALLTADFDRVHAMAKALRNNPDAASLLYPARGRAEMTLVWQDFGVWRRALIDWLIEDLPTTTVVDYKTTRSASPGAISKAVYEHGYHVQHAWYSDGVDALIQPEDVDFVFIFQEKTYPYLVSVVRLDSYAVTWGRILSAKAIDIYQRCKLSGEWPGYTDKPVEISLPGYALAQYERADERGDYYVSEVPF